jgi:hypothetical protein
MSEGFHNKGPSVAQLQKYVRDKTKLELILSNGEKITGSLKWADENAFALIEGEDSANPLTILRQHVIGYKAI